MGVSKEETALAAEPGDEEFGRCVDAVLELIDSGHPLIFAAAQGGFRFEMDESALRQAAERHGVTADRLRVALQDEIPDLSWFPTLKGPATFRELIERADLNAGHLRAAQGEATSRETIVARLSEEFAALADADDPYDRLDALAGFRVAVGSAVTRARARGLRNLGKALMMVRDAVAHLRAEELEAGHLTALEGVLGRLASRDPASDDLREIDRQLLSAGLNWVPVVDIPEDDES
ncbi:MAG: hypothetical protein FJX75_09215 [Armatimonadetes bacterium]|nr:hypothetical protein [Armatimonadota bacterium]